MALFDICICIYKQGVGVEGNKMMLKMILETLVASWHQNLEDQNGVCKKKEKGTFLFVLF